MKLTIRKLKQLIKEELRKKINETLTKDEQEYHEAAIDIMRLEVKLYHVILFGYFFLRPQST